MQFKRVLMSSLDIRKGAKFFSGPSLSTPVFAVTSADHRLRTQRNEFTVRKQRTRVIALSFVCISRKITLWQCKARKYTCIPFTQVTKAKQKATHRNTQRTQSTQAKRFLNILSLIHNPLITLIDKLQRRRHIQKLNPIKTASSSEIICRRNIAQMPKSEFLSKVCNFLVGHKCYILMYFFKIFIGRIFIGKTEVKLQLFSAFRCFLAKREKKSYLRFVL